MRVSGRKRGGRYYPSWRSRLLSDHAFPGPRRTTGSLSCWRLASVPRHPTCCARTSRSSFGESPSPARTSSAYFGQRILPAVRFSWGHTTTRGRGRTGSPTPRSVNVPSPGQTTGAPARRFSCTCWGGSHSSGCRGTCSWPSSTRKTSGTSTEMSSPLERSGAPAIRPGECRPRRLWSWTWWGAPAWSSTSMPTSSCTLPVGA